MPQPPFDPLGANIGTDGGGVPLRIPSGTSSPVVIKAAPGRLCRLINPGGAIAQTFSFYDDPTGAANNLLYTWTPAAGDVFNLQLFCVNGISVRVSASTAGAVLVEYY